MEKTELTPTRLEAFSDGVIAIIITIMVLELKVPQIDTLSALAKIWPVFLSYVLSFMMVAIYWINHHHLFHNVKKVDAPILWANMLLLFFLSLVPFFTAFMGENHISPFAVALYSTIMLVCAIAFWVLRITINRHFKDESESQIRHRAATNKNTFAMLFYLVALGCSYFNVGVSLICLCVPATMYFVPSVWIDKCVGRKPLKS